MITIIYRSPFTNNFLFQTFNRPDDKALTHLRTHNRISLFDPSSPTRTIIVKSHNLAILDIDARLVYTGYLIFQQRLNAIALVYPPSKPLSQLQLSDYPELFI